ncbi:MAG: GrpB family protein, partial [Clostridia bacterium]|nr:GrpB family protein [Clostridia bacterium]
MCISFSRRAIRELPLQSKGGCVSVAKRVIVTPYNEQWKNDFEIIRQYLLTAVKDIAIGIEHVGSTSVEGLS